MKTIAICGSARHRDAIHETSDILTRSGFIVLRPPLHRINALCGGQPAEMWELAWKGATFAHFNRVNKADVILIVNPDGYAGPSTTLELGYAVALGKLVVAMAPDREELARTVLFDVVLGCDTAREAASRLLALAGRPESNADAPESPATAPTEETDE